MKTPHTHKHYERSYLFSATGNPLTKFVNLCQSPEERRDKYHFSRFMGVDSYTAMTLRDWHWTKINLYLSSLNTQLSMPLDDLTPGGALTATT